VSVADLVTVSSVLVIFTVVVVRMRRLGISKFGILAFGLNTVTVLWLAFLFRWAPGSLLPMNSVVRWGCLILALLFIPSTIIGLTRDRTRSATDARRKGTEHSSRTAILQALLTLLLGGFWLVFIGTSTFGFLRMHRWSVLLGITGSFLLGFALVVAFREHRGVAE
jgi:hypothetical protein